MRGIILASGLSIVLSVTVTLVVTQQMRVQVTTAVDCPRLRDLLSRPVPHPPVPPELPEPPTVPVWPAPPERPMDTTYTPQGRLLPMPGTREGH